MPSKYVLKGGRLIASRDRKEVWVGSLLIADLVAAAYDVKLRQHAKGDLLDLGCGKAPLYLVYRDYAEQIVCVDWAGTLHKNDHLDLECDLTQLLPFRDGQFDTIVLSDVLEHIPDPDRLWGEIARVLRADGKLIMNVPFFYWLHERPHDYYRYTEFALRRFVDRSGLRLLELDPIGGVPEIMTDLFAKNVLKVPRVGNLLAVFSQWLTARFVRTRFGRNISESTRGTFPFGYFLVAEKA